MIEKVVYMCLRVLLLFFDTTIDLFLGGQKHLVVGENVQFLLYWSYCFESYNSRAVNKYRVSILLKGMLLLGIVETNAFGGSARVLIGLFDARQGEEELLKLICALGGRTSRWLGS